MGMIDIHGGHYVFDTFELDMDIVIPPKCFCAVLGPSGAGKSTLLNIIAGFEHLHSGRILLDESDHTKSPPANRPVSFVFQDNNSFAHMTARDNVALGISPSLKLHQEQWTEVDKALKQVGILELAHRKPGEMSGGERQRIALARVLVRNRPILLLDEAFAGLGPALRRDMLDLVKMLHQERGLTTLMVTHQPEDALRVADQIMFVDGGKGNAPLPTAAFFKSKDKAIQSYLGDVG